MLPLHYQFSSINKGLDLSQAVKIENLISMEITPFERLKSAIDAGRCPTQVSNITSRSVLDNLNTISSYVQRCRIYSGYQPPKVRYGRKLKSVLISKHNTDGGIVDTVTLIFEMAGDIRSECHHFILSADDYNCLLYTSLEDWKETSIGQRLIDYARDLSKKRIDYLVNELGEELAFEEKLKRVEI